MAVDVFFPCQVLDQNSEMCPLLSKNFIPLQFLVGLFHDWLRIVHPISEFLTVNLPDHLQFSRSIFFDAEDIHNEKIFRVRYEEQSELDKLRARLRFANKS